MARYDFRCPYCGHETYQEAPIQDGPTPQLCTNCTTADDGINSVFYAVMKRVWSAPGVVFRGGGWASKS